MPDESSYHLDAALTNISVAMLQRPEAFVAGRVFPNVPVQKQSDEYYVFDMGDFNRNEAKVRAPGTRVAEASYGFSLASYTCKERGLSTPITDQIRANADPGVPPDRAATEFVTLKGLIELEADWAASFFTTGIWGTSITGTSGTPGTGEVYQWSDYTNSDPIGDIRDGIDAVLLATGFKPNVLTMGRKVFSALIDHPDIQGRISGGATTSQPSIANRNILAQIFEVDEVVVGEAVYNTAKEGQTASNDWILGKHALLSYRPQASGIMIPASGYRFSWTGYMPGMNQYGFIIETKRRDEEDSDVVRYRTHYVNKLVTADLGYFFSGIVA